MGKPTPSEYFTLPQVAERLQVSIKTVRRLIQARSIPIERVGAQIRIRSELVGLFVEKSWK